MDGLGQMLHLIQVGNHVIGSGCEKVAQVLQSPTVKKTAGIALAFAFFWSLPVAQAIPGNRPGPDLQDRVSMLEETVYGLLANITALQEQLQG